jgi:hypothetical protein
MNIKSSFERIINIFLSNQILFCSKISFTDCKKAFDRVNWTKLMQILKGIGIDWRERRLISKLYMEECQNTIGPRGDEECEEWKRN